MSWVVGPTEAWYLGQLRDDEGNLLFPPSIGEEDYGFFDEEDA